MDYAKSGNPKSAKDRHAVPDQPRKGAPRSDETAAAKKAALLARMKAAAQAKTEG